MVNLESKPNSTNFDPFSEIEPPNEDNIRVLIADDQRSMREKLRYSLESEPNLEIVGSAADGKSAIAQIAKLNPDIALIDIQMPIMDGLTATQIIKRDFPNTKIIIFSVHDENEYINQAVRLGAKGYLQKNTPAAEIVHAIHYVYKGYLQLGPGLFEKLESQKLVTGNDRTVLERPLKAKYSGQTHVRDSQIVRTKPNPAPVLAKSVEPNGHDWSASTKELVDSLPQVWTRGLLYFLIVFVGIILPWAMLSKVDETGSARGKLTPQGKVFAVDAPVAGTVDEVFVEEGQFVKQKQPLVALDAQPVENELEQARTQLEGRKNELSQLKLLKNQLILTINTQKQQNEAQKAEKLAQLEQARQNVKHNQGAQQLAASSSKEADKEVQRFLKAKEQGIVSEIQVVEKEDVVRERQRAFKQAIADSEQARLRLREQEESYQSLIHSGNIALLRNEEQLKDLDKQIATLTSQIKENQAQIESLNYQLEQRIVKAPATGSIFQLANLQTGSVLEPGGAVAEIAPEGSELILKAQMNTAESGSLEQGMPVKLKFDAYPFQDYGVVEGELVKISPTTKVAENQPAQPTQPGQPAPGENYELEVELEQDYIDGKNKRVALRPGQTATAEVIVQERRLIDFVLDPFKKLNKDGLEL